MDLFFTLLIDFGLPVAASAVMGLFIYIILKYILGSVIGQVQGMHGIIMGLDNRIKTMNNDMISYPGRCETPRRQMSRNIVANMPRG